MSNVKYEEALGRAIKEAYEKDFDSIGFYNDMKRSDFDLSRYPKKRRPGFIRYFAVAASLLVFIFLSGALAIFISNGSVDAVRFNIEKQITKINNSITDSKEFTVGETYIALEIDDIKNLDKAKDFYPGLFVPKNMPDRFRFDSLKIKKMSGKSYQAIYTYSSENQGMLSINQEVIPEDGSYSVSVVNVTREIKKEDGTIYISENPFGDGANSASYITEESLIDICGMITVDEILDVY